MFVSFSYNHALTLRFNCRVKPHHRLVLSSPLSLCCCSCVRFYEINDRRCRSTSIR